MKLLITALAITISSTDPSSGSEFDKCVTDYEIWADDHLNGDVIPQGRERARIALQPLPWLETKYPSLNFTEIVMCARDGARKSNLKLHTERTAKRYKT